MVDAFGASRIKVKPPERGIFPLDHDGECKIYMQSYLNCLKTTSHDYYPCKSLSKEYLQCRMDHNLMKIEDLNTLGLGEDSSYTRMDANAGKKEQEGFVAGTGVKPSSKWRIF
jgi:hypothetical protein